MKACWPYIVLCLGVPAMLAAGIAILNVLATHSGLFIAPDALSAAILFLALGMPLAFSHLFRHRH